MWDSFSVQIQSGGMSERKKKGKTGQSGTKETETKG
jgi:hypothetical protein